MAASSRFGTRAHRRYPAERSALYDGVEAMLFVGLKPQVLSKRERHSFGGQMSDYITIRCVH